MVPSVRWPGHCIARAKREEDPLHAHPQALLPDLTAALAVVLLLATVLRRLGQPAPVVYLVAGVVLGPEGLALLEDRGLLEHLGELGVLLLMFLLGTEVSLPKLLAGWRVAAGGTLTQVLVSTGLVGLIGWWADWPLGRVVLLGFVISLSSTAVVLRLLRDRKLEDEEVGRDVLGILLAQDALIAPMLIVVGLLAGGGLDPGVLALQLPVFALLVGLVALAARGRLRVPARLAQSDPEVQVFAALFAAVALAALSAQAGLSAALGAFVSGLCLGASGHAEWVHRSLEPLRVILVATFLAAVGGMLDLTFFAEHLGEILALSGAALVTNTVVNAGVLRVFGLDWRPAWLGASLLAPIGELSFVVAAAGRYAGLVGDYAYQLTVSVIGCTLLASAAWVGGAARMLEQPEAARPLGGQAPRPQS